MFMEFVDRQQRESRRHLKIMEKLLKSQGMQVKSHLEDEDPYIFVKTTTPRLSFDGIRIYEIGEALAYRVVKEEKTEPYGKAYSLNLEQMFNDFMSENKMESEQAGKKVIESVLNELKKFFDKSATAEKELKAGDLDGTGIILRTGGTDYSSLVFNKP
jgi:hypothetical protein